MAIAKVCDTIAQGKCRLPTFSPQLERFVTEARYADLPLPVIDKAEGCWMCREL
jgi:hypothetical protein